MPQSRVPASAVRSVAVLTACAVLRESVSKVKVPFSKHDDQCIIASGAGSARLRRSLARHANGAMPCGVREHCGTSTRKCHCSVTVSVGDTAATLWHHPAHRGTRYSDPAGPMGSSPSPSPLPPSPLAPDSRSQAAGALLAVAAPVAAVAAAAVAAAGGTSDESLPESPAAASPPSMGVAPPVALLVAAAAAGGEAAGAAAGVSAAAGDITTSASTPSVGWCNGAA